MNDRARAGGLAALGLLTAGCGGGLPLLHPAQTLPEGEVRAEAGFSANVATGDLSGAITNAQADAAANGGPSADQTYTKGALALASVGPGLAPMAGARVGVGWTSEGGLVYTGRAVRADIRKSVTLGSNWALSIEAGGSSVLYGRQGGGPLYDVSLSQLHGWGADVPILVGYQSDGGLYQLWLGARGGWEHVDISDVTSEPKVNTLGGSPVSLSATRGWGGGVLGLAVGFRHVHVAMELDAAYMWITGSFGGTTANVGGVTLAPATALWWDF